MQPFETGRLVVVVVVVRTWCYTWVSVHPCAHAQLIKHKLVPAHQPLRLDQPAGKNPTPVPLREQVPGVPGANMNQPPGEEKDCEAHPPLLRLLTSQGEATFSIALTLEALGPDYPEWECQDISVHQRDEQ